MTNYSDLSGGFKGSPIELQYLRGNQSFVIGFLFFELL